MTTARQQHQSRSSVPDNPEEGIVTDGGGTARGAHTIGFLLVASPYLDILRLPGAWRFSLSGFVLRLPMSMVGISTILLVQATYGTYTLAGAVSATNIIALSFGAPVFARLVDAHGQRRIAVPAWALSVVSMSGLLVAAVVHAPIWIAFLCAAVSGATWGSPGALVRSRWATVVTSPRQMTTAYAFEAAMDEAVFIIGPILATTLGTFIHPGVGLAISAVALTVGGISFLSQRATEPAPTPRPAEGRPPRLLTNPVIVVLVLVNIGAGALFGANDLSVVAFTAEHGRPELAGVLMAAFALGSLTAALFYGARTWRQPLWFLFAAGILALAIGTSTFLLAHSIPVLALVMVVTGLAIAPTLANVNTIVTKIVPSSQLTEGLTWITTAMNVGTSVGSAIGGRAVDARGAHGGFLVVVVCAWVMTALMVVGLPRLRRDTTRTAPRLVPDPTAVTITDLPPELPGMPLEIPDVAPRTDQTRI